ncbi:transcriptional regulator [Saccharobesus litoralis]|uniref:Transcriptional regulator n=1 Tax=Saccharobesus litoralis TaxID=2172099 RepID=A0A2S0VUN9_9ALTE|nr:helix-turn-helix transcriptional regulator [Saccharobesus litoralis]AWB67882.1 transcriptional regulator [Saccharobesus litoralis]
MKTIHHPDYRKLIGWLTAERKFKKMDQTAVSEAMGWPNHTLLSKTERLERKLDVLEFVQLCKVLEVDPKEGIEILTQEKPTI